MVVAAVLDVVVGAVVVVTELVVVVSAPSAGSAESLRPAANATSKSRTIVALAATARSMFFRFAASTRDVVLVDAVPAVGGMTGWDSPAAAAGTAPTSMTLVSWSVGTTRVVLDANDVAKAPADAGRSEGSFAIAAASAAWVS